MAREKRPVCQQNPKVCQNGWYQNGKFLISESLAFGYPFVLVSVWVSLLQHPRWYQNEWGIKMASFLSFENLKFWNKQKVGTASLRSRTRIKRNAVFGARFKGLLCIFFIKKGIWYVSKRAWIHIWYVSKPVPLCHSTPLMIILKSSGARLFWYLFWVPPSLGRKLLGAGRGQKTRDGCVFSEVSQSGWLGVLEGGCLGRGLFVFNSKAREPRNREMNIWKQPPFQYFQIQYFEEPRKPRDEISENNPWIIQPPFGDPIGGRRGLARGIRPILSAPCFLSPPQGTGCRHNSSW